MGRLSNEAKAEKARQSLIETIAKIDDLDPILGGKWKRNMLTYYVNRLAELVVFQSGFSNPSSLAIETVASGIRDTLLPDRDNGG